MLNWLVSIQMPNGAFQGGTMASALVVPHPGLGATRFDC